MTQERLPTMPNTTTLRAVALLDPQESHGGIRLELHERPRADWDGTPDLRYRWYEVSSEGDLLDAAVTAASISEAYRAAKHSWAAPTWDLRLHMPM